MADSLSLRDELSGVATLLALGLVAAVLGAVPHVDGAWVFVGLVMLVLAWPRFVGGRPGRGDGSPEGASTDPAGASNAASSHGDGEAEPHDDEADEPASAGPLDIELVNWANALVGTTCARCEEEITYANLRTTDTRSDHRLACGCTIVEAASAE